MQCIVKEKVLCSAEKRSVIWAEPNSRSSAEPREPNVLPVKNTYYTRKKNSPRRSEQLW